MVLYSNTPLKQHQPSMCMEHEFVEEEGGLGTSLRQQLFIGVAWTDSVGYNSNKTEQHFAALQ